MKDAPRSHVRALLEWMIAAAIMATVVMVGSLLFDEARAIQASVSLAPDDEPPLDTPAGVPPGAVAVPLLLLPDGTTIRVGERAAGAVRRLGKDAHLTAETVDRGRSMERIIQIYVQAGTQVVLVIEPGANDVDRVTAIYVK